MLTDGNGTSEEDLVYYPYGETFTNTGTADVAYKYTGKERDGSTGLYFYEARYYDAALGRFISADTIVPDPTDPQAFNRYSYVINNPLRYTDPTGHGPFDQAIIDILDSILSTVGDFFTPTPPPPVFISNPGLPILPPVLPPGSFDFVRPQITQNAQAQRLGFSNIPFVQTNSFASGANVLAGGLFGLAGVTQSQLNTFQLGLAIGGATPGFGIFADTANVVTDLFAFDFGGAAIDGLSAFPILGLGSAPLSIGRRGHVLLDSSVIPDLARDPTLQGRLKLGELPLVSDITRAELRASTSLRGVPKILDDLSVVSHRPSLDLRINLRGKITDTYGRLGDGLIGAQAIELGIPLITNDRGLTRAVREFGGTVR